VNRCQVFYTDIGASEYDLGGPSVPSVTLYSQARACERSREASPPFVTDSLPQILSAMLQEHQA